MRTTHAGTPIIHRTPGQESPGFHIAAAKAKACAQNLQVVVVALSALMRKTLCKRRLVSGVLLACQIGGTS
jgi:hypothetical protein